MSDARPKIGSVTWRDLTVPDAETVRDFYAAVVGWKPAAVDMGGYSDYSMLTADGDCVAGICHSRGVNAGLPPQWLMYVTVADLDTAMRECTARGGAVIGQPRQHQGARFCVIRDPAGAVCALYQSAP